VIEAHPEIAARLKDAMTPGFTDVSSTRGFRRHAFWSVPTRKPCHPDAAGWRGPQAAGAKTIGLLDIDVAAAGAYDITLRTPAVASESLTRLRLARTT